VFFSNEKSKKRFMKSFLNKFGKVYFKQVKCEIWSPFWKVRILSCKPYYLKFLIICIFVSSTNSLPSERKRQTQMWGKNYSLEYVTPTIVLPESQCVFTTVSLARCQLKSDPWHLGTSYSSGTSVLKIATVFS
jgi:hypothetical protein